MCVCESGRDRVRIYFSVTLQAIVKCTVRIGSATEAEGRGRKNPPPPIHNQHSSHPQQLLSNQGIKPTKIPRPISSEHFLTLVLLVLRKTFAVNDGERRMARNRPEWRERAPPSGCLITRSSYFYWYSINSGHCAQKNLLSFSNENPPPIFIFGSSFIYSVFRDLQCLS